MTFLHLSFKNLSCTFCIIFVVFCLCLHCNFVNFRGWHLQISVYIFLLGSVFSSLTSSETSLSITRTCYLCCYVPDGLYPLKPRLRFRFLGYIRRLSKKQNKKERDNSRHFTNGLMAWHRDSMHLYSDKARCFNQSGRALYRNFIIKLNNATFKTRNISPFNYSMCVELILKISI